ncbi:hypothetical protein EUTSA_v10004779mg [Eutrema salsugineum]|uniref:Uncharacterized protein n=1 Tax=Eutrema salsugineum TaxID=72664 RepID=V4KN24_EUTSA|nr:uncharacterized protein LOC18012090 [Eutrema salsugineum]ESQ32679.1 hypothetical protein EUTSA_v10004779mg [Eutrema salsugineum]
MEKDGDYIASTASFSPSFSTYSGDRLAEIAERVSHDYYKDKGDEEFEFAILQSDRDASSSSGDGGLVFPVFDQNLVSAVEPDSVSPEAVVTPLKDLFLRERNDQEQQPQQAYSSSSDDEEEDEDEDELDAIPSEIYCPWTPERSAAEMSPSGGCRKSKSTGSSSTSSWSKRRWRIRDLLKRSNSDGKQSLKFLNPSSINESSKNKETTTVKKKEKEKVSAHEKFYLRNKAIKEEDKRKSYLPYKQDLVGLFSNINRYGKAFPPF